MSAKEHISLGQLTLPGMEDAFEKSRQEAISKFNVHTKDAHMSPEIANDLFRKSIGSTTIPTHILDKLSDTNINYTENRTPYGSQYTGEYFPKENYVWFNTTPKYADSPFVDQEHPNWLTHELGHSFDYHTLSEKNIRYAKRTADPRAEGVADGFMDRHSLHPEGFKHQTESSYGKGFGSWSAVDKAIYHGTRAHMAATGENVAFDDTGKEKKGAFLHKLTNLGPHAGEAIKLAGLESVARPHINRWKRTRRTGTQLSFFGDADYDTYDIPDSHMGPQFKVI